MFAHLDTVSTAKGIERNVKLRDFERKAKLFQDAPVSPTLRALLDEKRSAGQGIRRLLNSVSFGRSGRLASTR